MTAVGTTHALRQSRTALPRAATSAARVPFIAVLVYTFVALVGPHQLFPVLLSLHLGFLSMAVAAASHIADRMARSEAPTVMETEVRLVLLLCGLAVLSVPTSFWPSGSVDTLVELLSKSLIVFLLLANVIATPARFRALLWVLALCSTAPALYVVKDYVTGNLVRDRVQGYVSALASNPNDVALSLNIVIPLAVGLALASHSRGQRLTLAAVIALGVGGVVVTFSRAGFIFLSTTLLLYFTRLKKGRLGILLLVLLLVVLMLNVDGFVNRIQSITDVKGESSAHARWETMKNAVRLMLEYPLFGVGAGQSIIALNDTGAPRWSHVHNVYLEVGVDLGLPALAVYVLLVYHVLRSAAAAKRAWRGRNGELYYLAQGLEISLIGFVVAAMFYPIAYHLFFYYLAGLAVAVKRISREEPSAARPGAPSAERSR